MFMKMCKKRTVQNPIRKKLEKDKSVAFDEKEKESDNSSNSNSSSSEEDPKETV